MCLSPQEKHTHQGKMETTADEKISHSVASVNGTDDREAHPKYWVATLVQVRSEKAVGKKLDGLKIENYVPTQKEIHQWSDRKKKVERVIIPLVVFVHADKATIKRLITYTFIHKVLSYPGTNIPALIPDIQIETLKFMLKQSEALVEMRHTVFKTGDYVRVVRGPLKGLEGELCRVESDKSAVAVQIEGLGFACVNIDRSDLINLSVGIS